jgi:hypothetical protein
LLQAVAAAAGANLQEAKHSEYAAAAAAEPVVLLL